MSDNDGSHRGLPPAPVTNLAVDHLLRARVRESSLQTAAALAAIQAILVKKKLTSVKEIEALTAACAADMDQQVEELREREEGT